MTVQLMPVTTHAVSLRAQNTEGTTLLANSTALTQVSMPILTGKTIQKCRSQSKQLKVQPSITSIEPEICSAVEQKSSVSQVLSTIEVNSHHDCEDKITEEETYKKET